VKDRQCNLRYVAQCLYLMLLYSTHQHKSSILWMIATKTSQLVLQTSHDNLKLSSSFSADSWLWLRLAHYSTSVLRPNAEFTVEPCDLVPLVMYMPHLTLSRREYRALHHTLAQLRTSLASCSLSQSTVLHCTPGLPCSWPGQSPNTAACGRQDEERPLTLTCEISLHAVTYRWCDTVHAVSSNLQIGLVSQNAENSIQIIPQITKPLNSVKTIANHLSEENSFDQNSKLYKSKIVYGSHNSTADKFCNITQKQRLSTHGMSQTKAL